MYDTTAELGTPEETQNASGTVIKTYTYRLVYVDEMSIRQTEHYQSAAVGLRPDIALKMRRLDYQGERRVRYESKEYEVLRTYAPNRDFIELVLQGITNKGQLNGNT